MRILDGLRDAGRSDQGKRTDLAEIVTIQRDIERTDGDGATRPFELTADLGGNRVATAVDADEDEAGVGLDRPVQLRGKLGKEPSGSGLVEDVVRQFRLGFARSVAGGQRQPAAKAPLRSGGSIDGAPVAINVAPAPPAPTPSRVDTPVPARVAPRSRVALTLARRPR